MYLCGEKIEVLEGCENVVRVIWWLALAIDQEPTWRWLKTSRFMRPELRQAVEDALAAEPERALPPVPCFQPDLSRTPHATQI